MNEVMTPVAGSPDIRPVEAEDLTRQHGIGLHEVRRDERSALAGISARPPNV